MSPASARPGTPCTEQCTHIQLQLHRTCKPPSVPLPARAQVSYKEPTPPDTELVVRSHVVAVRENQNPGLGKAAVEVDVAILLPEADGSEKLLVQVGQGVWERGEVCVGGGQGAGHVSQAAQGWQAWAATNALQGCCPLSTHWLHVAGTNSNAGPVCVCVVLARPVQGTGIFKRLGALRAL